MNDEGFIQSTRWTVCWRMKKDLRIELFLEYLECLIHHILCLRGVYPEGKKKETLNSRTF
jgi:hypothetical protein